MALQYKYSAKLKTGRKINYNVKITLSEPTINGTIMTSVATHTGGAAPTRNTTMVAIYDPDSELSATEQFHNYILTLPRFKNATIIE